MGDAFQRAESGTQVRRCPPLPLRLGFPSGKGRRVRAGGEGEARRQPGQGEAAGAEPPEEVACEGGRAAPSRLPRLPPLA